MSGSRREADPEVREWAVVPAGRPGLVVRPSRMSGRIYRPLPDVWRPLWMSSCGWESHPDVQDWSGGPPGCLGVVGRPSQMSGSGR